MQSKARSVRHAGGQQAPNPREHSVQCESPSRPGWKHPDTQHLAIRAPIPKLRGEGKYLEMKVLTGTMK